ncbi:MAG TPA: isoprenylcysteine carboxylmethyltransferase family protein [Verrucomicrobiae bacterium]|nr:isoprenylcysteine carboxylmethyltransferase family protein [Verrucomicrobiae bacterium]
MNSERSFQLAFWLLLGLMMLMRIWFAIRVSRAGERLMLDRAAIRREGWKIYAIRVFVFLLLVVLIVPLARNPSRWRKLGFPLPFWLRWAGFALGLASLGLWTWTHVALGTLWSPQLQLRANHRLVASGPYSRIRHPMYTAILLWVMSLGFVIANWIPIIFAVGVAFLLLARVPREEQMMREQFGSEYREYMKRTGRFLPKWQGTP